MPTEPQHSAPLGDLAVRKPAARRDTRLSAGAAGLVIIAISLLLWAMIAVAVRALF